MQFRVACSLLLVSVAFASGCDQGAREKKGEQAQPASQLKTISVDALTLRKEADDEEAFKLKYKDVLVEVEGDVWTIDLTLDGFACRDKPRFGARVAIVGRKEMNNIFDAVDCLLRESDDFKKVGRKQKVRLKGRVCQEPIKGSLCLMDCVLARSSPSELPVVNAEDFALEYKKDHADFFKKYEKTQILVRGKVEKLSQLPPYNYRVAYLQGASDIAVACNLSIIGSTRFYEDTKIGDAVELLCLVQSYGTPEKMSDKVLALNDCQPMPQK